MFINFQKSDSKKRRRVHSEKKFADKEINLGRVYDGAFVHFDTQKELNGCKKHIKNNDYCS